MDDKDKKIMEIAFDKEIETLDILLIARVRRSAITLQEYIDLSLAQGVDPGILEANLLDDLNKGGKIFGELLNSIKTTVAGSFGRLRDGSQMALIGTDTKYRWVAVLINTCPDCLDRHGKVMKWEDWEAEGMPRTGQTVCGGNCHCVLLPEQASELLPIQRG